MSSASSPFIERAISPFFRGLKPRRNVVYARELGEAWRGDSRKLLSRLKPDSVDLILTSPPYPLLKKKAYGNESEEEYVRWIRPFARSFHRILKPEGSLVLNLGGVWMKGKPVRSLYPYRLLLDLCDSKTPTNRRFFLAQEFYWLNPAKLPNPIQWVNVDRVRVKDAVEPIWWLSKSEQPKANNRNVLIPYSNHMKRLIATNRYNRGPRPSGWVASDKWGTDNGGAIPPNFIAQDGLPILNLLVESNTASSDPLRRRLRGTETQPHPAMFPKGLPEFFIELLTDPGDVVVDPFAGSNTTGYVADLFHRQWLSIDLDGDYLEASRYRWETLVPNNEESERLEDGSMAG